jgi:hypothetical protein
MGLGVRAQRLVCKHLSLLNRVFRYFTVVLKLDPARLYATYFGGKSILLPFLSFSPDFLQRR